MLRVRSRPAGLAVPAYAHPAVAPEAWRRLGTLDLQAGFVILNIADGPGTGPDPCYLPITKALQRNGSTVCGYVDSDYGRRAPELVQRDAERYREWYGVTAVFVDQVAAAAEAERYYRAAVSDLRAAGTDLVVLNPGVVPVPAIADLGDIVVTFEGTWAEHRQLITPSWLLESRPAESVCHLVYSFPRRASVPRLLVQAHRGGAGIVGVSSGGLPNPWAMTGTWVAEDPSQQ
jgi:hypothetical protein